GSMKATKANGEIIVKTTIRAWRAAKIIKATKTATPTGTRAAINKYAPEAPESAVAVASPVTPATAAPPPSITPAKFSQLIGFSAVKSAPTGNDSRIPTKID